VLGGSGTVGAEVVKALAAAGVATTFTHHLSVERARALAAETGATTVACDLREPAAVRALVAALDPAPGIFVHCAGVSRAASLGETTDEDWDAAFAVNCRAPFLAVQALAARRPADAPPLMAVMVGALDRTQSLPMPVAFAATQGALPALAMALAKELGPRALVNVVALGVLEGGLSREVAPKLVNDYKTFSALRRLGTAAEAARPILWLALENTYVSGKVITVNGGI
jgi:3-oxoacyl-[acyl-carrier protein] reductase